MDCNDARSYLLDYNRGTLDATLRLALESHIAGCPECRHEQLADRELSTLLERLPQRQAPASLKRTLHGRWDRWDRSAPRTRSSSVVRTVAAMAVGAVMTILLVFAWRAHAPDSSMVAEAVNDHLRVLYAQRPLEVESGGIHQVKPWFEGKLDFAPVTAFAGDDDFPLQGGLVGYFIDRKAAVLVFRRRLHVITLFVFPSTGLRWPAVGSQAIGAARGSLETSRGFRVLLWRGGDLGYALVSDTNEADLLTLGAKIVGPS
jgi:anti-sigma factor RsiW